MTSAETEDGPESRAARHRDLEAIALTALGVGRKLMEAGARGRIVDTYVVELSKAMGVEHADTRAGYASLEMTVQKDQVTSTRMLAVGYHGVNQRLDQALRLYVLSLLDAHAHPKPETVDAAVDEIVRTTPHHPHWLMAIAAGIACAAFGRLLGADWPAAFVVLIAATAGQALRAVMRLRKHNVFVITMVVAFVASTIADLGATALGSHTEATAMIAAILLLVPGVPSLNALSDILEGRPTLGSARAVTVIMIMIFMATGLWIAGLLLGVGLVR